MRTNERMADASNGCPACWSFFNGTPWKNRRCHYALFSLFFSSLSFSLSLSLCSTNRRMTRTVTKGHDGGRISRFLIKRPVPLGYHGHAWHAIRVIAFDPRTRFPELFGCDRGKSGHSMLPSFLGERFGYYGHHQAEKSRDNWREICGILFCVCVCVCYAFSLTLRFVMTMVGCQFGIENRGNIVFFFFFWIYERFQFVHGSSESNNFKGNGKIMKDV